MPLGNTHQSNFSGSQTGSGAGQANFLPSVNLGSISGTPLSNECALSFLRLSVALSHRKHSKSTTTVYDQAVGWQTRKLSDGVETVEEESIVCVHVGERPWPCVNHFLQIGVRDLLSFLELQIFLKPAEYWRYLYTSLSHDKSLMVLTSYSSSSPFSL